MSETQWNKSNDPAQLWKLLRASGNVPERKLRLFLCACVRGILPLLVDERSRRAIDIAEQYADGQVNEGTLEQAMYYAEAAVSETNGDRYGWETAASAAEDTCITGYLAEQASFTMRECVSCAAFNLSTVQSKAVRRSEHRKQCRLLRCIFGPLPFRAVRFDPAWRTEAVVGLAQRAYEQRSLAAGTFDAERVAALADALKEAGCTDPDILAHLHSPGPHVRGCWVVDALLRKS